MIWYIIVAILLLWFYTNLKGGNNQENFVSGEEKLMVTYDQIYPLDDPRYITPQQKDFQVVLSEHSALDPNMQARRQDIQTQKCKLGEKCFNTREWHALNFKWKSSPDIINSKVDMEDIGPREILYTRPQSEKVVPFNSASREMRADLFDDIILPDLFFKQKRMINKGDPHPQDRQHQTDIF